MTLLPLLASPPVPPLASSPPRLPPSILLSDLLTATGAQLHTATDVEAWDDFCHDSRLAQPGQLFVALRTPSGDGHDHIADAVARGCTGVICQHLHPDHPPVATLLVNDTGDALRAWAAHILRKLQPTVVAITGSSGKTTAKELTADLLERAFPGQIFRTRDSYNDRLGLPLALARLRPHHRIAILELGTDAHGEIAELAALTRPHIAAITIINDAHLGTFGSLEAIAAEKTALLHALPPNGVAILNADDPFQQPFLAATDYTVLAHSAHAPTPIQLLPSTPIDASDQSSLTLLVRDPFRGVPIVNRQSLIVNLTTSLLGEHQLIPIRTAIAIALWFGVSLDQIRDGVQTFQPLPGRLRPLAGIHGATLLDDAYSANPAATQAALRVLAASHPPRLAILGEHSSLGPAAEPLLETLGSDVAASVDHLITVGAQAQAIARGAEAAGLAAACIHRADTAVAAIDLARPLLRAGGTCLLKGSREARLERITAALLAHPDAASDVLPRQTPAWQHLRLRNTLRPTWVEIDTLALADNIRAVRARLHPGVKLIAVLKADAYGHGAPTVARIAAAAGADCFAVACLPEAQTLRRAGIQTPILILGYTPPWQARAALEHDLQLTIYDRDVALALAQAAAALGRRATVHVKVDTGMGRLGLFPADVPALLRYLRTLPELETLGLFTHMAAADDPQEPHTNVQLARFDALLAELTAEGLRPPLVHAANTAAFLTRPDAHYDAVRIGIGLYGLAPAPGLSLPPEFRPVLSWKTTIAQVKTLPSGSPVGYGLTYRTEREQTLAIIPVGYADGFRRAPAALGLCVGAWSARASGRTGEYGSGGHRCHSHPWRSPRR